MIVAEIDGVKTPFRSEAAYIASQPALGSQPCESPLSPSSGAGRVRRLRKREAALGVYFKIVKRYIALYGTADECPVWAQVAEIHARAPKLTERVAKQHGILDLLSAIALAPEGGILIEPNKKITGA